MNTAEINKCQSSDIIARKISAFSEDEILEKLCEELEEALEAAFEFRVYRTEEKRNHMMEELADVAVAGYETLSQMYPYATQTYNSKFIHGIFEQMLQAVEQRELQQADTISRQLDLFDEESHV